ncbi:MAG: class I SAM-dependent methyltransferase [Bacteroidetes bacterium]|nr:class I SAM-dependent methyltransferase [Bacteroidota bacterium]
MSKQTETVIRFLRHRIKAKSKFDLHSPFIYQFYSNVVNDKTKYPEPRQVERLRSRLLKDQGYIKMSDLGAGAGDIPWCHRIIPVTRVVRRSCVQPAYGRFLFRMARYFKPAVMVELGTSLGISTSYLALGNPEGVITTIEGCQETAAFARKNFEHLSLLNVNQLTGPFEEVLPGLLEKLGKVDLVFIDGNHRKKPSLHYFYQCLQHIHEDSVLILDDIHWSGEMEKAWKEIQEHPSVTITIDLFRMGLVFFKSGLSKEDFILRF